MDTKILFSYNKIIFFCVLAVSLTGCIYKMVYLEDIVNNIFQQNVTKSHCIEKSNVIYFQNVTKYIQLFKKLLKNKY